MKRIILLLPILTVSAACVPDGSQSTATGAAAGAALGAAVNDDDRLEGAIVGGAAGAVAGTLLGRAQSPGDCVYRDQYGNRYVADCP